MPRTKAMGHLCKSRKPFYRDKRILLYIPLGCLALGFISPECQLSILDASISLYKTVPKCNEIAHDYVKVLFVLGLTDVQMYPCALGRHQTMMQSCILSHQDWFLVVL